MKNELKTYAVYQNGRRVYVADAKSKRGALKEAKDFLRSLGDDVDNTEYTVEEFGNRPLRMW